MLSDQHLADEAAYATFIQCIGAATLKTDVNILGDKFVAKKMNEIRTCQISLEDIYHTVGAFPTEKDLNYFLGKIFLVPFGLALKGFDINTRKPIYHFKCLKQWHV